MLEELWAEEPTIQDRFERSRQDGRFAEGEHLECLIKGGRRGEEFTTRSHNLLSNVMWEEVEFEGTWQKAVMRWVVYSSVAVHSGGEYEPPVGSAKLLCEMMSTQNTAAADLALLPCVEGPSQRSSICY